MTDGCLTGPILYVDNGYIVHREIKNGKCSQDLLQIGKQWDYVQAGDERQMTELNTLQWIQEPNRQKSLFFWQ